MIFLEDVPNLFSSTTRFEIQGLKGRWNNDLVVVFHVAIVISALGEASPFLAERLA